jgi:hypothetical protein
MNSFTQTIFDFVVETEERLSTAFEIHGSWEDIQNELFHQFQKEITEEIKRNLIETIPGIGDFRVDYCDDNDCEISIYRESWKIDNRTICCIAAQKMRGQVFYGIYTEHDIKHMAKRIDAYWKENNLNRETVDEYYGYSKCFGYDFRDIKSFSRLATPTRPQLVLEYSRILLDLLKEYYPHIDRIIAKIRAK